MRRYAVLLGVVASMAASCGPSANVEQERNNLLTLDREWSQTIKDTDKFLSYFAPDATAYPQGMPATTGAAAIRDTWTKMISAPGFALSWSPTKADVGATGDLGYTAGMYEMSMGGPAEKGKYVTIWKKQTDGAWKVMEDIFNADAGAPAAQHVMVAPSAITWGDAPPSLPPGSRIAVVSGDPAQAQPFVLRAQVPDPAAARVVEVGRDHAHRLPRRARNGLGPQRQRQALDQVGRRSVVGPPRGDQ